MNKIKFLRLTYRVTSRDDLEGYFSHFLKCLINSYLWAKIAFLILEMTRHFCGHT